MAFTTPSPYFFACFPLQEYFVNKDTGFPLAAGVVEFFSDAAFTVPKDVYQQNQSGSAGNYTYTYVNLGSKLILSSVGTFQDNNGNDIIPFLYPFTGTPPATSTDRPDGTIELYFIRVWSKDPSVYSDAVLQFTRSGWPPNFSSIGSFNDDFDSTQNIYSNPQFSEVSFTVDPATSVYTYPVSGAVTLNIAPGWTLSANTSSSGNIRLKQIELNNTYLTEPSYAIQIDTDSSITQLKLTQRINQSPRILYNQYVSAFLLARCLNNIEVAITTTYTPSSGTPVLILQGSTSSNGEFTEIAGVDNVSVIIDGTVNTDPPSSGYVDLVTSFDSGRILQFTSFQAITVLDPNSLVPFVEQSTPQMTNALFWYYKPQLEYKPIPSYALGWDFGMNPFQAQGIGAVGPYNITGPGKSFYVADQTILFQNTTNTTTVSRENNRYIKLAVSGSATSLALIQYLGPSEAAELLNNPVCSLVRGNISSGTVVGQIRLYFTQDANLPTLGADETANCYSLVSAVNTTSATPTVGGGGNYGTWTEVPRNNEGTAYFTLTATNTSFGFAGWDASSVSGIASATYFAIVVSLAEIPTGQNVQFEHISLQKGDIPTPPAALSFGETLTGLQQYYEKSYDWSTVPTTATAIGSYAYVAYLVGSTEFALTVPYKVSKRAIPSFTASPTTYSNMGIISVDDGAYSVVYEQGVTNRPVVTVISSQNNFWFTVDATSISLNKTIEFQFVADARFGVQN